MKRKHLIKQGELFDKTMIEDKFARIMFHWLENDWLVKEQ
jgi:hypothetical protein